MIKFFRKIRQKLLTEHKFSKYLLYAIGEIVLVVIGILIALQINNWNNYNLDRISEKDYLTRISNDLISDTLNFSWTIKSLKNKQESLGSLLELINKEQIITVDSTTVLRYLMSGTNLSIAHPGIANGTFEELKNTGAMKHFRSTLLRSAINDYYFKSEHRNDRIEKRRTGSNYSLNINSIIPGMERIDGELGYRNDLVSYKDILERIKDFDFKKNIISEYNSATFMLRMQEGGLDDSKALLNLVMEELKK